MEHEPQWTEWITMISSDLACARRALASTSGQCDSFLLARIVEDEAILQRLGDAASSGEQVTA